MKMKFLFLLFRNETLAVAQQRIVKARYLRHFRPLKDNSEPEGQYLKVEVKYDIFIEKAQTRTNRS
jgi:hypothetical protein